MTVGKAIFYLLDNSTDLTAIVGTRIYPEVAQQDAPLPYVVYNISNNEPSDTKREPSKMDTANIEVNCYSTSYTQVIDMSVAVRAALDRVTGTYSGVNVQSIAYMNEVIDFDEGQRAYNVSSDYDVRISRTDFEIAQGSPITGVDLGDLADVNTTGVTNGQVIAYDAATAVWLPATDAGGAEQLNDLSDVIISLPASGEFFRYNGGEWVNDTAIKSDVGLGNVDNTSDANKPISTDTQTALDLKADITSVPTELDDLNDVQIIGTPTLGQALVYGAGKWLPGAAGATDLGDLDDVNTTGAAFGSLLTYNGASWDISGSQLPTDDIYFHQRYETESEALRTGATATTELYFTCTAQGNGLAESASSDTPTAGKIIKRKIYYSEEGFADPDTGTWVEFTPAPADDASFATVKAALLEYLKARTGGAVPISLKQTWEEVAAAPTFTGLLNETYGSGAEAAYSTRRLNGNVTDCMVIRRASDSTTTTIGFDGSGNISEADIISFCTGTSCTVYQWLDQSGNGNTATAAAPANEPTIYTGGAIVKENGKVAVDFDGANHWLDLGTNQLGSTELFADSNDAFSVYQYATIDTQGTVFSKAVATGANRDYQLYYQNEWAYYIRGAFSLTGITDKRMLASFNWDGSNAAANFNGTSQTVNIGTAGKSTQDINIGARSDGGFLLDGKNQEIIVFDSSKSASDRTSIEENVGDYFTQNTPLLDTYSGAAAAYSLRLLDSSYVGSAIRVRRSSDNTEQDIGFNVFSELDTVSLLAFAGTGDAFVKTWYDQSGNSNDATQTATGSQPKIVSSGAVIVENGKPMIIEGTSTSAALLTTLAGSSTAYMFATMFLDSRSMFLTEVGSNDYLLAARSGNFGSSSSNYTLNNSFVNGASTSLATQDEVYQAFVGAQKIATLDVDSSNITAGYEFGFHGLSGYGLYNLQEVIIFHSDQSSNRTNIETNIATFYDITI